jgi:hypothetical protein
LFRWDIPVKQKEENVTMIWQKRYERLHLNLD